MTRPMPPARITSPISTGDTYERPAFIQVRIAGSMDRYSTRTRSSPVAGLGTGSSVNGQSVAVGRPTGRAARRHWVFTSVTMQSPVRVVVAEHLSTNVSLTVGWGVRRRGEGGPSAGVLGGGRYDRHTVGTGVVVSP